ncbi:hypothetical protein GCM10023238_38150 [Streptomyces heliomycini]
MGRTEYYNDPAAPKANTLIPASNLLVADETGAILLQRRRDTGQWALPGGAQDIGETAAQCAVRECLEETGIIAEVTGFLGVYTNPNHIVAYTDGEIRQQYENTYIAAPSAERPRSTTRPTASASSSRPTWTNTTSTPACASRSGTTSPAPIPTLAERQGGLDPLDRREDLRCRPSDEPTDQAVRAVTVDDLHDPCLRGRPATHGRRRHVAVHEGVHQQRIVQQRNSAASSSLSPRSSASSSANEWFATRRVSLSPAPCSSRRKRAPSSGWKR